MEKKTFCEWLKILQEGLKYQNYEVRFDWSTNIYHFKWIGK